MSQLDQTMANQFAGIALGHVQREYPNHIMHVFADSDDGGTPSTLHPVFYGSFDWHSCVHGYWLLARLLLLYPDMARAEAIRTLFDTMLSANRIAGECAYFDRPAARGFERPYGWAWLLKLAAELHGHENPVWAERLAPLAGRIVTRFTDFLPLSPYPVRTGTHYNTAFALRLTADYAEVSGNTALLSLLQETAQRWYGSDRACPAWGEPSGDDFLSSSLIEAECMRRLLPKDQFESWFADFFPDLAKGKPEAIFSPASVSDRSDGKIAHLDGLNLSRAWCFAALAEALTMDDPRRVVLTSAAERHLESALAHVSGDYMGEHWLASFAVLALTPHR
ncbi:DUF2891 domain-containing protein [Allorhizobium sp. BGMRC 0089]|uniref:DUF2891 domain-containing protein n=1 Tax=Allorhizobium sonneratiae TaxID=2934936 RepID=UPI00203467DF|nr:DUF2891 domain-containing protein [Allorhizobium sonneratiae]MCM2292098.1 DUF2891 domain-containing protein [Allorhizobium sonneratiae]